MYIDLHLLVNGEQWVKSFSSYLSILVFALLGKRGIINTGEASTCMIMER